MKPVTYAVMQALDMPDDLKEVQDAYWRAQRAWAELDQAYRLVVADMLRRGESNQESRDSE